MHIAQILYKLKREDMELSFLYTSLSILFTIALFFKLLPSNTAKRNINLPPCPLALPVIGHLHLLTGLNIHRSLQKLSRKFGPVMSLWAGSRLAIVISSPSAFKECFTKNDIAFANRPDFMTFSRYFSYDNTSIFGAPYGDNWKKQRRLITHELFSSARLDAFLYIRKNEVEILLQDLFKISSKSFAKVEMTSKFSALSFNIIVRMFSGKRYYGNDGSNGTEAKEFTELISQMIEMGGLWPPNDFVPFLQWINYKNHKKNIAIVHKKLDALVQNLIEELRGDTSKNTLINQLLIMQVSQPEYYTDTMIKGLVMNLVGGSDTSSVTLEWALSLLVNHPNVLEKAITEIHTNVGHNKLLEEDDLLHLPYLQAIINETLRLFPAAPILVPRMSSEDCTISGYDVPRGTLLVVNAWAIHRDPEVWDEPTKFMPERFDGIKLDGNQLLPFGMGRRMCPGYVMAQRVMGLALGSLIQCFEWKRESEELVDLRERVGLTMPKIESLTVMCKSRDIMTKLFPKTE